MLFTLGVAAKAFPGFLLAGVLRQSRSLGFRITATLAVVIGTLSLPYVGSPYPYAHDIFFYDARKSAQGLSWQHLLIHLTTSGEANRIGYALLAAFACATIWLSRLRDLDRFAMVTFMLFLLCSKVVLEQYLIWPLPLLVIALWTSARQIGRASLAIMVLFTLIGMLSNETTHPWGRSPWPADIAIACACAAYSGLLIHANLATHTTEPRMLHSSA